MSTRVFLSSLISRAYQHSGSERHEQEKPTAMQLCQLWAWSLLSGVEKLPCQRWEVRIETSSEVQNNVVWGMKRNTRWYQEGTIYVTLARSGESEAQPSNQVWESAKLQLVWRLAQKWQLGKAWHIGVDCIPHELQIFIRCPGALLVP